MMKFTFRNQCFEANENELLQILSCPTAVVFSIIQRMEDGLHAFESYTIKTPNDISRALSKKSAELGRHGFIFCVISDSEGYNGKDQVFPIRPEQLIFMDSIDVGSIQDRRVLEIGIGCGVISIFNILSGASSATGLEINPRAIAFSKFNAHFNGVEDRFKIIVGSRENIFEGVKHKQFDRILSNPPFEPTPPALAGQLDTDGGRYGLDIIEKILRGFACHMLPNGTLTLVAMAPGSKSFPEMLVQMSKLHLGDLAKVEITLDQGAIGFEDFLRRFKKANSNEEEIEEMVTQGIEDGVTHYQLAVLKYTNGSVGNITLNTTPKLYESWEIPFRSRTALQLTKFSSGTTPVNSIVPHARAVKIE